MVRSVKASDSIHGSCRYVDRILWANIAIPYNVSSELCDHSSDGTQHNKLSPEKIVDSRSLGRV